MSLIQISLQLWRYISKKRKKQYSILFILMLLVSIFEFVSIGAVLPFLAFISNPSGSVFGSQISKILNSSIFFSDADRTLLVTIFFCVTVLIAGALRLLLAWASTRLSFSTGADLSSDIYKNTLMQPYKVHINRNSSEIINAVIGKTNILIFQGLVPILNILTAITMLAVVLCGLLMINPLVTILLCCGFVIIYTSITYISKKALADNSLLIAKNSNFVIKVLQEGLGGIRDVLIDRTQGLYCSIYKDADIPMRRSQGNNLFISNSPRYAMESFGMVLIASLAFWMTKTDSRSEIIPILGVFALAAQKILPVLQSLYSSYTTIVGYKDSIIDALDLLSQKTTEGGGDYAPLSFSKVIELKNISYRYTENKNTLNDICIQIPKGSRVGIIGKTGSGKSTLLDIIMGLLNPTKGGLFVDDILVDGTNVGTWQQFIAHVPQSIFLTDSSVVKNIAFGVEESKIDYERVYLVAKQAQISDAIEQLSEKYNTILGERGIKLSGGQRQRIGIARALYKNAKIIIFDEATSALDAETESLVMETIRGLGPDLTILMVAHRTTSLKDCEFIFEMNNGSIMRTIRYEDIASNDFRGSIND